jgi:hypothetical protein
LISFLQVYLDNNVKSSFNDLTFSLENMIRDFLNVFEDKDHQYINSNQHRYNYPAIDLYSKGHDRVIQVTTIADAKKVRKTEDTYSRHGFSDNELVVIGFVKNTKPTSYFASVVGHDYLSDKAKYGTTEQRNKVIGVMEEHVPWNLLSPYTDQMCYQVVYRVIRRDAVLHDCRSEGSYEDMVGGLKGIKEIINTGKIKGKEIRAKALANYGSDVQDALADIDYDLSTIIKICNRSKNDNGGYMVYLNAKERMKVDKLKQEIIQKADKLAHFLDIKVQQNSSDEE